ncbi:tetratricopeptide repeat protein [Prosthecobacter fluviatilis]|uniref:Tetratricopeptide repeat protein n=2 Tax=Prosthecobacter fluviatilis TaxID=445931 RepID=A0ABW0KTX4_9BACT
MSALRGEAVRIEDTGPVSLITLAGDSSVDLDRAAMLADADDLVCIEESSAQEIQNRLATDMAAERVFTLFLPLFDASLTRSCRMSIAEEIEEALEIRQDSIQVAKNRFYSSPFPFSQRLEEALSIASEAKTVALTSFLRVLSRCQPLIAEVAEAWSSVPLSAFPSGLDPEAARSTLIQAGSFARLVEHRANHWSLGFFLSVEKGRHPICGMPMLDTWFSKWTLQLYFKDQATRITPEALDAYRKELDGWKDSIMELARTRPEGARQAALLLKKQQLDRGHPRFAAMSLCDLAIRSKARGMHQMQLIFAELAVRANPHDPQCYNQFADALKQLRQFERAFSVYETTAVDHPDNAVAKNGKAEVLRDLNRPTEALECYEATILAHPDNSVAKCGKAEVLRDLNRLSDALECYEMTLLTHPENAFAKCGKAEVLRDLNRLSDALECYEATILEHPSDTVAKCGKAEVLRDLNRLSDALECYEAIILEHADNAVAKNGKAEVFRDLNKLTDALECYEMTIQEHPDNAFAKCGKAEVLRDLNRLSDALECYEETILEHPKHTVAKCGKAEVLRDLNRLSDALECYEMTIQEHPDNAVAKNGKAEVLRDLNRLSDALECYEEAILAHPDNSFAKCGKAEVLRDLNRLSDALECYEATILAHPNEAVAKNGKAEVLRDLNRLSDALECYEATILAHPNDAVAKCGKAEVLRDLNRLSDALECYEETILAHPNVAVAKTGKAEVLRDLNRLSDALECYEATILQHPDNSFAKRGRANILALLKRFSEALEDLPAFPVSAQDWIGYHMRGMILLRSGLRAESEEIFNHGLNSTMPRRFMQYFKSAAALCKLRKGMASEALSLLPQAGRGDLRCIVPLLRAHAFGILGQTESCRPTMELLLQSRQPFFLDVAKEVEARYLHNSARHSMDWLVAREEELVMAA